MLFQARMIPDEIIQEYNLKKLFTNNMILAQINRDVYGLPQAGRIAYNKIVTHLEKVVYVPTGRTPGFFKYTSRPIYVCLVVDDFGVKYVHKADAQHIIDHLPQ